jgi:flavodoxin
MTTYSIVFSSRTGNTALLADCIKETLPSEALVYCGSPTDNMPSADIICVGFWTDRGNANQEASNFLKALHNQKLFLFGTAGFGGSEQYFEHILRTIFIDIDPSNIILGTFMCQGKMPVSVRERYQTMSDKEPVKAKEMIENFDKALNHPDKEDISQLRKAVIEAVEI